MVSIIVPVYNVEKYLGECLDSILFQQATDDYEIVLVNDGSTDGSEEICKQYAMQNSKIKYFYQTNQGLSAARNTGIKLAQGDYLLFLDSDDKLKENSLPLLIKAMESRSDVIFAKVIKFQDGEEEKGVECYPVNLCDYEQYKKPALLLHKLNQNKYFWFAAWLLIVKREFLVSNNLYFYHGIYHEDELWVPTVMVAAQSVTLVDDFFYLYRVERQDSIMSMPNIKKELDKLFIADLITKNKKKSQGVSKKVLSFRAAILVWGVVKKCNVYKEDPEYSKLKTEILSRLRYLKYGKYWLRYGLLRLGKVKL